MSDPLSVTGSAVGIVSLGLYLCNAIVRYAQDARGQSDDIKYLATKASHIHSSLKLLRELIAETENDLPDVAKDLDSKASGLQVYLDRLKGPIEKYKRSQDAVAGVRSRARRTWETAIYHFKKEELFEVRDCLQSIEMDLNTALNVCSARGVHKIGVMQDIFNLKQDLLIEKMNALQLSITAPSHKTILQAQTANSISRRESFSVQSYRTPVAYNWKNMRAKPGRKQYIYYSKWLSRAFTGTFCFSTEPSIFPIVSLHCHAVVGRESWLGKMYLEKGHFIQGQTGSELLKRVENWIQLFQSAVSDGDLRPNDELLIPHFTSGIHLSLIDLPFLWHGTLTPDIFPQLCKYITFMLDHNVTTNYRSPYSAFRQLCKAFIWTEEAHNLASYIIERCGPINWAPASWSEKRNMQILLQKDEDSIDLPSAFIAVLRESERDLRDLLDSKLSSCEDSFDGVSLLQVAMGWPAGVRLLLKAQSGIHLHDWYYHAYRYPTSMSGITDEDNRIDEYSDCCNILLEAGYAISPSDIIWNSSRTLACLFIDELAKRRRNLLSIAEAHIHPSELSDLRKGETGIPDAYAPALCDALTRKGYKVDQKLMSSEPDSLFCHNRTDLPLEILDKIYEAGFTDMDLPFKRGYTPLMTFCRFIHFNPKDNGRAIGWLISKGADPFRKLPGSNTTALHLINVRLAEKIHCECVFHNHFDPHVALCHLHQIDMHLFSLSTRDECSCSCSIDGCTPLSAAIRAVVDKLCLGHQQTTHVASVFRRDLEFLIDHSQSKPEVCHAMIRSLTFAGLGLSHTCCIELRYLDPWEFVPDGSDLQEMREEQKIPLERFEKLVSEFDAQFDATGLPFMDFLKEIWYKRMVKFLSERDRYDPEHHQKTRELGVPLEMDEVEIPLVVQLICDQVRVVESDSEDL